MTDAPARDTSLQVTNRRVCDLERGQARRVPQNPCIEAACYLTCCPSCGYVTTVMPEVVTLIESDDGIRIKLTEPLQCHICIHSLEGAETTSTRGESTQHVEHEPSIALGVLEEAPEAVEANARRRRSRAVKVRTRDSDDKPWLYPSFSEVFDGLRDWLEKHCESCHRDIATGDLEGDPRFTTETE